MNLYFVRHGSAGEPNPQEDAARGLDPQGRQQCELIGKFLKAHGVRFDDVVSSPLRRASEAAAIVAKRTRYKGEIALAPALRPDGTYERFLELLDEIGSVDSVLLVGHNSKLAECIGRLLTGNGKRADIHLKQGAVAKIVMKHKVATLKWCLTPRLLRACLGNGAGRNGRARDGRR
jgi:phosphohistidine phosphatase